MWGLILLSGIESAPPAVEGRVLTTEQPGNSTCLFLKPTTYLLSHLLGYIHYGLELLLVSSAV